MRPLVVWGWDFPVQWAIQVKVCIELHAVYSALVLRNTAVNAIKQVIFVNLVSPGYTRITTVARTKANPRMPTIAICFILNISITAWVAFNHSSGCVLLRMDLYR